MKYRKKPVVIEAIRISNNDKEIEDFLQPANGYWVGKNSLNQLYVEIKTLEGTMRADNGDWIIKGVKGEFYPCKHDIFEETYERVNEL